MLNETKIKKFLVKNKILAKENFSIECCEVDDDSIIISISMKDIDCSLEIYLSYEDHIVELSD